MTKTDDRIYEIKKRFEQKDKIFQKRKQEIDWQNETMRLIAGQRGTELTSYTATSVAEVPTMSYTSFLPLMGINHMMGVKLFADFIDFRPERTNVLPETEVHAGDLTELHSLVRNMGGWKKATKGAQMDLIRGESFIYRDMIQKPDSNELDYIKYEPIPWECVRQNYDSADWIIATDLTKNKYISIYGEENYKKAGTGSILDIDKEKEGNVDIDKEKKGNVIDGDREKTTQVLRYIDPATKTFIEIHGRDYVYQDFSGDDYYFLDQKGRPFAPIYHTKCYEPVEGYHGWGILDFLIPLARTETIITNASIQRAMLKADPLVMIHSDDPTETSKQYQQHLTNRLHGTRTPFFMKNSNIGTTAQAQNLDEGSDNGNHQYWQEFIITQATMRTGIDFRQMTEFAPTANQQQIRKQEQDRVNRVIIERNAEGLKDMALQDIYMIQRRECAFNDEILYLAPYPWEAENAEPEMLNSKGEYPPRELTAREVANSIDDMRIDIEPRLEGAMDDNSFMEISSLKQDSQMIPPGTKAHEKFLDYYFNKVSPGIGYKAGDSSKPFEPEQQEQLPPPMSPNQGENGALPNLPTLNENLQSL